MGGFGAELGQVYQDLRLLIYGNLFKQNIKFVGDFIVIFAGNIFIKYFSGRGDIFNWKKYFIMLVAGNVSIKDVSRLGKGRGWTDCERP